MMCCFSRNDHDSWVALDFVGACLQAMACFQAVRFLFWVHIRCCGYCGWRFRPYGESLFQTPKRNQKALLLRSALAGSGPFAPGSIRAQRLRFASLHLLPLCLAAPDGRCAPTPGSIPALSLPMSLVRQDQDQKHSSWRSLLSGEKRVVGFGSAVYSPLTPALSRGRGGRFVGRSELEYDSVLHVGVCLPITAVSPLSLRERARVRGF
ncbi:hypothetical protein SAMN05216579_2553 [Pseudomonas granadensis]|nr:hypothetical protein SAMN05216579_2553 [Pseudomonas granadensis]